MKELLKLLICIVICQMAGVIGSFFTVVSIDTWYKTLNQPSFNPPDWVFAPVWIFLYCTIGVSLYLVIRDDFRSKQSYLLVFLIQLGLNTIWSIIFFGYQSIAGGFVVIILLLVSIIILLMKAFKYSKIASYILVPYLLWVGFATVLNGFYLLLN